MRHPATNAITSGPTPIDAAIRAAVDSTCRSIPRSSVSFPGARTTTVSPSSNDTLKLWLVIPPPRGSMSNSRPGQTAATTSSGRMHANSAPPRPA
jgi:hypothetical protein